MTVNELIEKLQKLKEKEGDKVGNAIVLIDQMDICERGKAIDIEFHEEGYGGIGKVVWIVCEDIFSY